MTTTRAIARRLLVTVLTLVVTSIVIFAIVQILPGDVARLRAGQFATPAQVRLAHQQLGLDRPLVVRYLDWARDFVTGRWGESWRLQIPIAPYVVQRLENSLILAGLALLVIVPVSILGGVLAALRRGRLVDRAVMTGGMLGIALPEFVSGMLLILVFSLWLPIFPSSALVPQGASPLSNTAGLVLPTLALVFVLFGYISRMVRASMIEELKSDYTRTALLNGFTRRRVVTRHVLPNALLPSITVIANQVSWLVGGLVVVENVFNYPGIGNVLLSAALSKDVPVLEIVVLILATALILANLAADLLYGVVDPRVRVKPVS